MSSSNWPFGTLRRHAYGVIYADPPWSFQTHSGPSVPQRAAEQHYPVMSIGDLARLPVADLAAPDCALFMWTIRSHLPQALWLGQRWGFTYASRAFVWAKHRRPPKDDPEKFYGMPPEADARWEMGLGYGTRANAEDCYLFTRGAPKRLDAGVRELIVAPLQEHSRKPDEARRRIERLFAGPRAELFARTSAPGWSAWGNEVARFAS